MPNTLSYIKLEDCVNEYLDASEQSIHKFFKYHNLAYRALTELGLDFFYKVKSVKLLVRGNKTVAIPADCLQWNKIGALNSSGEVVPLKQNDKMTLFASGLPDRIQKDEDATIDNFYTQDPYIFYNYWDNGAFGNLYGIPSGGYGVGQFKVDLSGGVILLNPDFCFDYLIVEYVSAPKEDETYYIPIQFKEAVIAYIGWKDIQFLPNSRKGGLSDKRDRKHDYYNERRLAIARFKPLRLDQAYEQNLESQRLTIKG
jgi:hypothetical protein